MHGTNPVIQILRDFWQFSAEESFKSFSSSLAMGDQDLWTYLIKQCNEDVLTPSRPTHMLWVFQSPARRR
jgi:hypothetical protein